MSYFVTQDGSLDGSVLMTQVFISNSSEDAAFAVDLVNDYSTSDTTSMARSEKNVPFTS